MNVKSGLTVNAMTGQIQWNCDDAVHANMNIAKGNKIATRHVRYNLASGPLRATFCLQALS